MENIKEFDFTFRTNSPKRYAYKAILEKERALLETIKKQKENNNIDFNPILYGKVTDNINWELNRELVFDPQLAKFQHYNGICALNELLKDNDSFDFIFKTNDSMDSKDEVQNFPEDKNYVVDESANYEDLNILAAKMVEEEKNNQERIRKQDKRDRLKCAIALILGTTVIASGTYLFGLSQKAEAIVDERHDARMVDNAGTVIYKNGEPEKGEYLEAFKKLLGEDIEKVENFFETIGFALKGGR